MVWLQLSYQDTVTRLEGMPERVERPRSAAPWVSLPELSGLGRCADATFGMPSQLPNDRRAPMGRVARAVPPARLASRLRWSSTVSSEG